MKKYFSITKILMIIMTSLFLLGCVHDDQYDDPALDGYQCQDLTATLTIAEVKALHGSTRYVFPENSTAIMEGYVSSSDETGNIYKTIYIQDDPVNPTQGFVISIDAVSNYTKYPQGSKIYIKLNGLALGTYGSLVQLGVEDANAIATGVDAVSRIPEREVPNHIFKSCSEKKEIVPKVMTLAEMVTSNDKFLGCLIQVNDVEFDKRALCSVYAPPTVTVDRTIGEGWNNTTSAYVKTAVVRNSGYSSFANQILPSGNGKFVGIYSKFNSTYQMYIVRASDLDMEGDKNGNGADEEHFPRLDKITANPCGFDATTLTKKTVAQVKQLYTMGNFTQISENAYVKATVTANDETGNLFKYVYIEDATGGIKVNINKQRLYEDIRFRVGKNVIIKLKDLYIGKSGGELQLGQPFNGNIGQIAETDVYKYFFDSKENIITVTATEKTIPQLTADDVGKWIKIKGVQFVEKDLGEPYASGGVTNRTLKDCSGNQIILRTSNFAKFYDKIVDPGQGDIYAILSVFNGTYQLWIPYQVNADFDNPRCDNAVAPSILFSEEFGSVLNSQNWTAVSVTGAQVWSTSNTGASGYYAVMNGYANGVNNANEDWLISKEISLVGFNTINLNFDSDVNFNGSPLKLFITENYTGTPSTTSWTEIPATFDTQSGWGFVNSGNISLNAYAGKKVRIAYKYVSTTSAANTWELDNIKVKAKL